jgi:hypothetical protein
MKQVNANSTKRRGARLMPALPGVAIWILAWPAIMVGGLVALLSVGLFVLDWHEYQHAASSVGWPSVTGTVQMAQPMWEHSDEDNTNADDPGQTFAEVQYAYEVAGHAYTNDGIASDPMETDVPGHDAQGKIRDIVAQYHEGQTVKAYYDPAWPNSSYLKPGAHFSRGGQWQFMAFFAGVILCAGVFVLALGLILRRYWRSLLARRANQPSNDHEPGHE